MNTTNSVSEATNQALQNARARRAANEEEIAQLEKRALAEQQADQRRELATRAKALAKKRADLAAMKSELASKAAALADHLDAIIELASAADVDAASIEAIGRSLGETDDAIREYIGGPRIDLRVSMIAGDVRRELATILKDAERFDIARLYGDFFVPAV